MMVIDHQPGAPGLRCRRLARCHGGGDLRDGGAAVAPPRAVHGRGRRCHRGEPDGRCGRRHGHVCQHPNATPRTLRVASELVAAGAPLADIARLLYRTTEYPAAPLRQRAVTAGDGRGRTAGVGHPRTRWTASQPDAPEESEGIIDLLAQSSTAAVPSCSGTWVTRTRISTRTREGGVDAIALTAAFGGEDTHGPRGRR